VRSALTWRRAGAPSLVLLALVVSGCFTTAADFGDDAETFIASNEELRATLFPDSDTGFTTVTCVDPENQDVGTAFPCTATDGDGEIWEFEIVITGSNEYDVNLARRPDGS
jgi:hypothetical protein